MATTSVSTRDCAVGIARVEMEVSIREIEAGIRVMREETPVGDVPVLLPKGSENDLLTVCVQEDIESGRGSREVEERGRGHAGRERELRGGREGREGKHLGGTTARHW